MCWLYLAIITEKLFSLPLTKVDIHIGHVRMYAMRYHIFWIIHVYILVLFSISTTLLKMQQNYSYSLWLHVAKSIGSLKRVE